MIEKRGDIHPDYTPISCGGVPPVGHPTVDELKADDPLIHIVKEAKKQRVAEFRDEIKPCFVVKDEQE